MYVKAIGVNFKTSPVEERENLFVPADRYPAALERLKADYSLPQAVIISTCNRTEVYVSSQQDLPDCDLIARFLAEFQGVPAEQFADSMYAFEGDECVKHLFRVASSLDSMVVGETQITAQVKEAYHYALKQGHSGKTLNKLFQRALAVAKKVRTRTRISEGRVSVSSAAVALAEKVLGRLSGKTVLVVGAGEMAELTLKHLISRGASHVLVTNRTHEKGIALAGTCGGEAVPMEQLCDAVSKSDIVICSTSAAEHLIGKDQVASCLHDRDNKPIFFIDIAVPRNVDPEGGSLDNVYLHNIDHLESVVAGNIEERQKEIDKSSGIIESEVERFMKWLNRHR